MKKRYGVKITRQALEQLEEIKDYIAGELCAPDAARRLLLLLKREMTKLSFMPESVPLTEEELWRSARIHKKPVKNFLVYFWIDETAMKVQVIAVVYAGRDQRQALARMDMTSEDEAGTL